MLGAVWRLSTCSGDDTALATLQRSGGSRLYSIDLKSGRARDRGAIGNGESVRDIAISPMR
jgi:hypothetical protein